MSDNEHKLPPGLKKQVMAVREAASGPFLKAARVTARSPLC